MRFSDGPSPAPLINTEGYPFLPADSEDGKRITRQMRIHQRIMLLAPNHATAEVTPGDSEPE